MPWKIEDVESHKAGLSTKQKKQWVNIANSVLKSCMDDGGDESSCAVSAIKQANGGVNTNTMENYSIQIADYQIKVKTYQGKQHLIVPVVMMVEGVHSGSHGPLFHSAEELGKFPASWNGIPVMINHPSVDGHDVSANSPEVLNQAVGRVFNTYMDDKKLKGEVWLDENQLSSISPSVLSAIRNGRQLDVSVGVFSDEEPIEGIYTNESGEEETYNAIAKNHRPDHLAILPSGVSGACGWNDGCGIRANNASDQQIKTEKNEDMKDESITVMRQFALDTFMTTIQDNKQGFQELMSKISEQLYSRDKEDEYYILEEAYDDSIVYRKRVHENPEASGYFQESYQINSEGKIEFSGEPKRVRREVSYVQVNKMQRTIFNHKKGDKNMDKPCCAEKVTALISNTLTNFTEEDREWLSGIGEERLERLTPKVPQTVEVVKEVPSTINMEAYVEKASIKTFEDVLAIAPDTLKDTLKSGLKLHQEHREGLVQSILDNAEEGAWTKEELTAFDTAMLEKLNKQFKPAVNYAGQAAGSNMQVNNSSNTDEILMPNVGK